MNLHVLPINFYKKILHHSYYINTNSVIIHIEERIMTEVKDITTTFKRINDKKITLCHLSADIIALILSHIIFLGRYRLPYRDIFSHTLCYKNQHLSIPIAASIIILIWLFAFYISGHYSNTARKSGLQIIGPTAVTASIMSFLIFFILDNYAPIELESNSVSLSIRYLTLVFFIIFVFRMIIISRLHHLIITGRRGYKKILIGNNDQALKIIIESNNPQVLTNNFVGYLYDKNKEAHDLSQSLPCLGSIDQIESLVKKEEIDEAIVCLQATLHNRINYVINILRQKEILIRLSTETNTMIEGTVKTQNIESLPFITISSYKIPAWQHLFKRTFDMTMASVGLLVTSPICIALSIAIKITSKGPIYYKQERIGKYKKPFMIYKFRSMYVDAEKKGPALASSDDPRITSLGKYMRKWRLDELPQFINIILGNMSFVGPRPERQHFINQILPKAPHYAHLFTVRPGITSWGMVKFGYAENITQMIERLQYDIQYLENRSLVVDFKILLYTLKTISNGEGK